MSICFGVCSVPPKSLSPSQNDLLFLKVTSQLHHLSIKCAIHVLHVNAFNPHCLRRRPVEEVKECLNKLIEASTNYLVSAKGDRKAAVYRDTTESLLLGTCT